MFAVKNYSLLNFLSSHRIPSSKNHSKIRTNKQLTYNDTQKSGSVRTNK